jgi:hypothetical protein
MGRYDWRMRIRLTFDERVSRDLQTIAHRLRKSARQPRRYRLEPASLGSPLAGIDLNKALQIADSLHDLEFARKTDLRK